MISIKELTEKVSLVVKEKYGEDKILFDPIVRKEEDKYYFGFLVIEEVGDRFVNNSAYSSIKRPVDWLLVDMFDGNVLGFYNSNSKDYTSNEVLPFDKIFKNEGNRAIYEYVNKFMSAYNKFTKEIKKDLEDKAINDEFKELNDIKVFAIDDEVISPKDFILSSIDSVMEDAFWDFTNKLDIAGRVAYEKYFDICLNKIRNEYLETGVINEGTVSEYLNLVKYNWPSNVEIINNFDNVLVNKNKSLDDTIESALKRLEEKDKDFRNKSGEEVDKMFKEINEKIASMTNNPQ